MRGHAERVVLVQSAAIMSIDPDAALRLFETTFGGKPEIVVRAPGRVNLIGEHTDYNHGFVLPMAIDRDTVIAAQRRPDRVLHLHSANFDERASIELGRWERTSAHPWVDYIAGVAREIAKLGHPLCGADCLLIGDVPIGSGLSSSASVEMAALALFEALGGFTLSAGDAASLGQRVENDFLGVASGIMDQFIVRAGKAGHALFLDCRSLEFEHVPILMNETAFIVADTGVARGLAGSAYNVRVRECGEAVAALNAHTGKNATHLRDFTLEDLEDARHAMDDTIYRRARHVISENSRTLGACEALRAGFAERLGGLFNDSDRSLRVDYEVTCPELDAMTAIGRSLDGCYGSRMTGAGFGGCTVHLVRRDAIPEFCSSIKKTFAFSTGRHPDVVVVSPSRGVHSLTN